ncbi:hypothetical protein ACRAWD_06980 [Caulobacter segnis]
MIENYMAAVYNEPRIVGVLGQRQAGSSRLPDRLRSPGRSGPGFLPTDHAPRSPVLRGVFLCGLGYYRWSGEGANARASAIRNIRTSIPTGDAGPRT